MAERITLIADDDYIYTNGEVYGFTIYLAEGMSAEGFYQITREEYEAMINASEEEQATDEDYQNALRELGVKI